MAAHRYWRMLISANGFGSYASMAELQAFISADSSGTSDLLGTTTAASSIYALGPSALIDGNFTNFWMTSGGVNGEWVSFDLGAGVTKDLRSLTIYARNDAYANRCPSAGSWQWSDDNLAWTTAFTFSGTTTPAAGQVQYFPAVQLATSYFDGNKKSAGISLNQPQLVANSTAAGTVATNRALSGKHYAELIATTLTGTPIAGLVNSSYAMGTQLLGSDNNGVGYRSGGTVVLNAVTLATLAAFVQGDRIGVAVDAAARLIWFRVNNGNWNNNVANNPTTGVGGISYSTMGGSHFIAVAASLTGTYWTGQLAASSFTDVAPTGFTSVDNFAASVFNGDAASRAVTFATYGRANGPGRPVSPKQRSCFPASDAPALRAWYGGNKIWSPAGTTTTVSGTVQENGGVVVGRRVDVYDRNSGELLGFATSSATGTWSVPCLGRPAVRIVGSDPTTFNSLVFDNVVPA